MFIRLRYCDLWETSMEMVTLTLSGNNSPSKRNCQEYLNKLLFLASERNHDTHLLLLWQGKIIYVGQ